MPNKSIDSRARLATSPRVGVMVTSSLESGAVVRHINDDAIALLGDAIHMAIGKPLTDLMEACPTREQYGRVFQALRNGQSYFDIVGLPGRDGSGTRIALSVERLLGLEADARVCVWSMRELESAPRAKEIRDGESLGRLVAGVAHDFSNIVAIVRAFATLIADAAPPDSRQHNYAQRIVATVDRAADLVRQIIAVTRGRSTPRQPLRLRAILEEVKQLLSGRLFTAIRIVEINEDTDDTVLGNESQLIQVFFNLAVNACDGMGEQTGILSMSFAAVDAIPMESAPFTAGLQAALGRPLFATGELIAGVSYLKVSIADTGIGIPEHILAEIFEPFFTTKEKRRGTGLGLAIVRGIVEAHDGVVTVGSILNQGTIFEVYLPRHATARLSH